MEAIPLCPLIALRLSRWGHILVSYQFSSDHLAKWVTTGSCKQENCGTGPFGSLHVPCYADDQSF